MEVLSYSSQLERWLETEDIGRFVWSSRPATFALLRTDGELTLVDVPSKKLVWSRKLPALFEPLLVLNSGTPLLYGPSEFLFTLSEKEPVPIGDRTRAFSQHGYHIWITRDGFLVERSIEEASPRGLFISCSPRYSSIGVSPSRRRVATLIGTVNSTFLNLYEWDGGQWNQKQTAAVPEVPGLGKVFLVQSYNDLVFIDDEHIVYFAAFDERHPKATEAPRIVLDPNDTPSSMTRVFLVRSRVSDGLSNVIAEVTIQASVEAAAFQQGRLFVVDAESNSLFVAGARTIWKLTLRTMDGESKPDR